MKNKIKNLENKIEKIENSIYKYEEKISNLIKEKETLSDKIKTLKYNVFVETEEKKYQDFLKASEGIDFLVYYKYDKENGGICYEKELYKTEYENSYFNYNTLSEINYGKETIKKYINDITTLKNINKKLLNTLSEKYLPFSQKVFNIFKKYGTYNNCDKRNLYVYELYIRPLSIEISKGESIYGEHPNGDIIENAILGWGGNYYLLKLLLDDNIEEAKRVISIYYEYGHIVRYADYYYCDNGRVEKKQLIFTKEGFHKFCKTNRHLASEKEKLRLENCDLKGIKYY